jgi:hypothetical protein
MLYLITFAKILIIREEPSMLAAYQRVINYNARF